ncbi:unnamed protein product [Adineta steineri]|uniref:Kringle domain-containing protein n=1 Tax=Adineta steineri TaxID=433720 RepID=A0A814HMY7_9BILA|nr:unnamed protein product [Adineta steineri]CAF1251413.1 unnamed protein product [Adineta steineri]
MFLHVLTIIAIIGNLSSKSIITKNISDCSITQNGILHYYGKHSFTKFQDECLPWSDMKIDYPEVINKANFFNDGSIKAAKNYCRNPNMNVNGPWCFIQNEDAITMEQCEVCQSLVLRSTIPPTHIEFIDDVTVANVTRISFQDVYDELTRYSIYIREKVAQIVERLRGKFRQLQSGALKYYNIKIKPFFKKT